MESSKTLYFFFREFAFFPQTINLTMQQFCKIIPLDKAPELTKQADDSYAYTVEGVGLTAGDIEYKMLTKEGGWNGWKLPVDGNNKFNIAKAGTYNVTFTLSADLSSQNAVATLVSEGEVLPTIQLHGDFKVSSWSTLDAFTYNEAKTEATFVVTELEAEKTYEFGLKFDGSWKANGATITASANSTDLGEGSGNMHLTTTIAGDYTFTYVLATEVLTVTYPVPSALSNIEVENAAVKVIRDGQVLIVREGVTYNLMGQTIQ